MAKLATKPPREEVPRVGGRTGQGTWPRRLLAALMLPREHGAWAMLLMPYLVGTAAAGWGGWASLLLLVSLLLLFSSSRPLELALRRPGNRVGAGLRPDRPGGTGASRAGPRPAPTDTQEVNQRRQQALLRLAAYLGFGGTATALLLLLFQRWALLPMGAVAGVALMAQLPLRRRQLDRSWPARLLSIAALSASGPAAYYVTSGALDRQALAVWVLAFLYSAASVFYVRLLHGLPVRQKPGAAEDDRGRAERQLLAYLVLATLTLATFTYLGWLPPLSLLAFVPLAAKAAWASWNRGYRPTLRQVGFAEIGHASLFALLATLAVATWG